MVSRLLSSALQSDLFQWKVLVLTGPRQVGKTTLLRELAANGAAILLYTSELAEIALVCDRVIILHAGQIVDEQDAALATEASLLTAAHGLELV